MERGDGEGAVEEAAASSQLRKLHMAMEPTEMADGEFFVFKGLVNSLK